MNSVCAVVWDFDGTLVDTRAKNMSVNRRIIEKVTGRSWREWECLESLEKYERVLRRVRNWRELYQHEFGLTPEDTDRAGSLWTPLQAEDTTPTHVFDGIPDAVAALNHVTHAIVSQNSRTTIEDRLADAGIGSRFDAVIGYAEVGRDRQKPHPDGLLACLDQLADGTDGSFLFVGDHPTDTECAIEANRVLEGRGQPARFVAVAACFGDIYDTDDWAIRPDHVARHPREIVAIASEI